MLLSSLVSAAHAALERSDAAAAAAGDAMTAAGSAMEAAKLAGVHAKAALAAAQMALELEHRLVADNNNKQSYSEAWMRTVLGPKHELIHQHQGHGHQDNDKVVTYIGGGGGVLPDGDPPDLLNSIKGSHDPISWEVSSAGHISEHVTEREQLPWERGGGVMVDGGGDGVAEGRPGVETLGDRHRLEVSTKFC